MELAGHTKSEQGTEEFRIQNFSLRRSLFIGSEFPKAAVAPSATRQRAVFDLGSHLSHGVLECWSVGVLNENNLGHNSECKTSEKHFRRRVLAWSLDS